MKKHREGFRYFWKKLNNLEGTKREVTEKKILRYFYQCQNIQMLPNSQDCLDILNEMQNEMQNYKL